MTISNQAEGIRITPRTEPPEHRGRLRPLQKGNTLTLAVTSGKGGVGKTQVSSNVGIALAKRGKRVVMLDADLGLASLDLALGVRPEHDLMSVVRGQRTIDEILVEGPHGLFLIPACPGRYEMANLGVRERSILCHAVEEILPRFDVLIIDTGAGIGSNAVSFASWADEILLVAVPEPTSIRDAYAMAKVLHVRSGVDRVQLVANQVASEREGYDLHERVDQIVRQFLKLELKYLASIPRDESVRAGVASGEPCVMSHPESRAARAFDALGHRLVSEFSPRESL
jgi:flagellar biosynthesis protein FlhG